MDNMGLGIIFEGNNLLRLLGGLWITIKISFISVFVSIFLGIILGMIMTVNSRIIRVITKIYLEFMRIMPQLVLLFVIYFGATKVFGIDIDGQTSAFIVFILWGTAEMGDLVRGAILSIPKHQFESGTALALKKHQVYLYIIIPQTIRRLIPQAINLTTRMIKTTSLIVMIGVVEVLKVGQQIIEANRYTAPDAALWIYGVIFFLYFIVCYPISKAATILEKKWASN